ncbi:MAG: BamA/TamA family outer membrane protein [Bacteroidales bacterium]|nr:BamA/TamA family outer membrane protein [Bacteroidales bacterium]
MNRFTHSIVFLMVLFVIGQTVQAQKIFYATENESGKPGQMTGTSKLMYTIYLLGDIKNSETGKQNLQLLQQYIAKDGKQSAVIVLGDIVYPLGLPDSLDKKYKEAERDLKQILHTFDVYDGQVFFLPGNHDWAKGRKQGWESVKNEERYIEQYFGNNNVYLPDQGCPGPVEIELTPDITLIVFDSQWWFQNNEKPGFNGECGFTDKAELFIRIEDALRRNKDKKVIFTTHHPLFSAGKHGGHFPASYLLFPLLEINKWLYLPLPGFMYTGYRKFLGDIQDLAHPEYKIFGKTLLGIFQDYPNVIYAAGHEHNLQYFHADSLHHIVSGGGGAASYIARKKKKADFACQCSGFGKLSFFSNGDVWMEFITTDTNSLNKTIFSKKLFNKTVFDSRKKEARLQSLDFSDRVVRVKLTEIYNVGKPRRFIMGNNYRNIWNTPVDLPVFDIGHEKGGLSIIKRGGGMQTRSLRLEDKNGKQYVLRSVNKYADKVLPENFQNTIALKPIQDAISASFPFAAITIPTLADAAGVMHTNPKIVWVPDDPRLGVYRKEMADGVFLFEERPAGNREDVASFGFSKKIISTGKVVTKTQNDHDHQIDQKSVLRARLFDMLINDWDRHDDQWRWASFKDGRQTTYRPIPRDRDQAYFVNEGFITRLALITWPTRKFQGFDYTIKDVKGLAFNARHFDRSFLTEPSLDDWLAVATDIKNKVADTVIHKAIAVLPPNIYDSTGLEIENKIKSRRNLLPHYAAEYYRFLAKAVDVTGTKEREFFKVERTENGNTRLSVYALSNKKGKVKEQLYSRDFKFDETKEIRLYGLDGKDIFWVSGSGKRGIKVRIIGGKGKDSIIDESKVRGWGKKTVVYDRKDKKNGIVKSSETRLQLSKNKSVNTYNRKLFKHNRVMPLIWAGYNIDDGIFLGGGVKITRFQFRDSTIQKIRGNLAIQTGAFAVSYEGLFSAVSPTFDLTLTADVSFPRNVDNFFGLGNETQKLTDDKKYYRVRYTYAWVNPMLKQTINKNIYYSFGAFYQYFMVTDTAGRFIGDGYPLLLDSSAYLPHHYTGLNAMFQLDTRNDKALPVRGIFWETEALGYYSIRDEGRNFVKLRSDLRFYLSFRKDPRIVFVLRFGGAMNLGDYEFYHANFLGGKTNLRGFRSNRFAGDVSVFQNTEVRIKLTDIRSYIFNGQAGLLLFNDLGRVWVNGENSSRWHDGYGIGLWLTPFDFTALTLTYNRSAEDGFIDFKFSYLF